MSGYLERMVAGAREPRGTFHPLVGAGYARPEVSQAEALGGEQAADASFASLAAPSARRTVLDEAGRGAAPDRASLPILREEPGGGDRVGASSKGQPDATQDATERGTAAASREEHQVPRSASGGSVRSDESEEERSRPGRERGQAELPHIFSAQGSTDHVADLSGPSQEVGERRRSPSVGSGLQPRLSQRVDDAALPGSTLDEDDKARQEVARPPSERSSSERSNSLSRAFDQMEDDAASWLPAARGGREATSSASSAQSEPVAAIRAKQAFQPLVPLSASVVRAPSLAGPGAARADRRMSRKEAGRESPRAGDLPVREPDEIQIHIGRIEVMAVPPAPVQSQPYAARKTPSLDEYLRRGNGRG